MAYNDHPGYQKHSETSKAAANKIASRAPGLRARALNFIRDCGDHGATSDEVQAFLGQTTSTKISEHSSGSARVSELLQDGLIIESGRYRKTRSGNDAAVLIIAPPGTPLRPSKRQTNQRPLPEGFTDEELSRLYEDFRDICTVAQANGVKFSPEIIKLAQWLELHAMPDAQSAV